MNIYERYTDKEITEIRKLLRLMIEAGVESKTRVMLSTHLSSSAMRTHMIRYLEQNPNVSPAEIEREVIRIVKAEA